MVTAAQQANTDGIFVVTPKLLNWSWRAYERLVESGFLLELEPPDTTRRWPRVRWYRITEAGRSYLKAYKA